MLISANQSDVVQIPPASQRLTDPSGTCWYRSVAKVSLCAQKLCWYSYCASVVGDCYMVATGLQSSTVIADCEAANRPHALQRPDGIG